jgi:hypothetical protein
MLRRPHPGPPPQAGEGEDQRLPNDLSAITHTVQAGLLDRARRWTGVVLCFLSRLRGRAGVICVRLSER